MRHAAAIFLSIFSFIFLFGCDSNQPATPVPPPPPVSTATPASTGNEPPPPAPPVTESFDQAPQLNLFPRVGAYRPEEKDKEKLGYWNAFIDHVLRTSGMRPKSGRDNSHGWAMHGIRGIDSIAFFSPLAVQPNTTYRVSFDFKGDLPKGASAGIGIIEFDQFLWVGEQFTETMAKEHQTATWPGVKVSTTTPWQNHTFTFTTSPRAGMIHLVLFREGPMDREKPVFFDNVAITAVPLG